MGMVLADEKSEEVIFMSFIPDIEGVNIGAEANFLIDNFALNQVISTQKRLHICNDNCPGCGNEVLDASDRLDWADGKGRWKIVPLALPKPRTPIDGDGYPINKHNRNNRKRRK